MPGHGAPDDSLNEEELSSSPCPLVLLRKKELKATKELEHLVDIVPQTPELGKRIRQLKTLLEKYKVITKNQKYIFIVLHEINCDRLIFYFYIN